MTYIQVILIGVLLCAIAAPTLGWMLSIAEDRAGKAAPLIPALGLLATVGLIIGVTMVLLPVIIALYRTDWTAVL